ncbi:hypothetical protein [Motilimonas eburnea]|uniref:hypothetical protein n=1 Tax=Motilimonas eburnea TaxID=1737488 RepID=UPI001E33847E|nr:hypothetical protein [Motilimonas eburnea]MCE2572433.1 hypothetical protein [Motilimonas eburnea]
MAIFLYEVDALLSQKELQNINAALAFNSVDQLTLAHFSHLQHRFDFLETEEYRSWLRYEGADYLHNPRLLINAPLSALCGLIAYIINHTNKSTDSIRCHPDFAELLSNRLKAFICH